MGVLNKIGGAILAAGLLLAIIIGFQTPTGRQFWDGIWQSVSAVVNYIGNQGVRLNGTAAAGNIGVSVAIAAIAFLVVITLVPPLRVGRGFAILAILFTALAFILYQPSILGG